MDLYCAWWLDVFPEDKSGCFSSESVLRTRVSVNNQFVCLIAHHLQEEMFEDLMDISVLELKEERPLNKCPREFQRAKKRKKKNSSRQSATQEYQREISKTLQKGKRTQIKKQPSYWGIFNSDTKCKKTEFQCNNLEHRISCPVQTLKYEDLIKTFSCIQGLKN